MTFHSAWGFWNGEPGMDRLLYFAIQEELRAIANEILMAPGPSYWGKDQAKVLLQDQPDAVFAGVEVW